MHQDAAAQQKLLSPRTYVFRALFILLAMSISIASLVWCLRHGGSLWWLAASDVLLIAACRKAFTAIMETVLPIIAATDALGIVLLAVLLLAVPLVAPFALLWTVRQAIKAGPRR